MSMIRAQESEIKSSGIVVARGAKTPHPGKSGRISSVYSKPSPIPYSFLKKLALKLIPGIVTLFQKMQDVLLIFTTNTDKSHNNLSMKSIII